MKLQADINPATQNLGALKGHIQYVYDNFLSKPYTDTKTCADESHTYVLGERIERPNHALRHVITKMALVPVVLAAVRKSGNAERIQAYAGIDDKEVLRIQIALLFSVVGRQSEASARQGQKAYAAYIQYRYNSAIAFEKYVAEHFPHLFNDEQRNKYKNYIQYGGYGEEARKNEVELEIFNHTHTLELFRTYTYDLSKNNIQYFSGRYGNELVEYARDLLVAGGERVIGFAPFGEPGNFEMNAKRFYECSTNVDACIQHLAQVAPPYLVHHMQAKKPDVQHQAPKGQNDELEKLQIQKKQLEDELQLYKIIQANEGGVMKEIVDRENILVDINLKMKQIQIERPSVSKKDELKINFNAKNYEVKVVNQPCHDGVLRDEIKIPGDHNCCFNAALVGAKHAGVQLPPNIQHHYALRKKVADVIEQRIQSGQLSDQDISAAIIGYNREFGANIRTAYEYIGVIKKLDVWGGEFELKIMADILGVNIRIHQANLSHPPFIINNGSANTIDVHHTGNHYNLYVPQGAWKDIPAGDPVKQFDQQLHAERLLLLQGQLQLKPANDNQAIANKVYGRTQEGIPITYNNYLTFSHQLKNLETRAEVLSQKLAHPDKELNAEPLRRELKSCLSEAELKKKTLLQIRAVFQASQSLQAQMDTRAHALNIAYNHQIYLVEMAEVNVQNLIFQHIEAMRKDPHANTTIQLAKALEEARTIQKDILQKTQITVDDINTEMQFILRELKPGVMHEKRAMVYQAKNTNFQRKLVLQEKGRTNLDDTVAMVHLKAYLASQYQPGMTLQENIKKFFQDEIVLDMLEQGGPIGGLRNLDKPEARFIYKRGASGQKGQLDEELIEHYTQQLTKMLVSEGVHSDTVVLYNAMDSVKAVGNDVIREISSILNGKGYQAMFRLFTEDFSFEDAEAFRQEIYQHKKLHDGDGEFHKRGIACGVSPFQPLSQESPLDLWTHDSNIQTFDRFQQEIFPKLKSVINDPNAFQALKLQYNELKELSETLGARMTQFMLSKEDADKFTWISGAYGYKIPAVYEKEGKFYPTHNLSEAVNFYKKNPDVFIRMSKIARQQYVDDPNHQVEFEHHTEGDNRRKIYDPAFHQDDAKTLGQLQARMYLHPELFEPGRMQMNVFFSLPPDQKILAEYNSKVSEFSANMCAMIVTAKQQQRLQGEDVPLELMKSVVGYKPYKYADNAKYKQAYALLKDWAGVAEPAPKQGLLGPEIYTNLVGLLRLSTGESSAGKATIVEKYINQHAKTDEDKSKLVPILLCFSIKNSDAVIFRALVDYCLSDKYNSKDFPINLEVLSDGTATESALMMAAKQGATDILQQLLEVRAKQIGMIWTQSNHMQIRRTAEEPVTKNTPLHYLAMYGDFAAFMSMMRSLTTKRSYTSYVSQVGLQANASDNTPLHILAFNDPERLKARMEILNELLKRENHTAFNTLFGEHALTLPNKKGVSPLMVAAFTQNTQAILLIAEKIHLSDNQKQFYLWLAQAPFERLALIQGHSAEYGEIPGFVSPDWVIPQEFKQLQPSQSEATVKAPLNVEALKQDFEQSLLQGEQQAFHAYNELYAQLGEDIHGYVSALIPKLSSHSKTQELEMLSNLTSRCNIKVAFVSKADENPFLAAARRGDLQMVEQLLNHKTELHVKRTFQDAQGKNALHYLMANPQAGTVVNMAVKNASWGQYAYVSSDPMRQKDNQGMTPLHIAALTGNEAVLNAIEQEFATPASLLFSQSGGLYNKLAKAALDTDQKGRTPIMVAVLAHPNQPTLIQLLGSAMNLSSTQMQAYQSIANALQAGRDVGAGLLKQAGWPAESLPCRARDEFVQQDRGTGPRQF